MAQTARMEQITRARVIEPLTGERVIRTGRIDITLVPAIGPERWAIVDARGRNVGGGEGGRILITLGGVQEPLAGLVWFVERGQAYVSHVWVDSDARGRGLSQLLFDAYRAAVTADLIVVGPFTAAGRAAAERAGAVLME